MISGLSSLLDKVKSGVRRLSDTLYLRPEEMAFLLVICGLTLVGAVVSTLKNASARIAEDGQVAAFQTPARPSAVLPGADSAAPMLDSATYFSSQRDSLSRLMAGGAARTQMDSFFGQLEDAPVKVVNINEATVADLAGLPGIGEKLAQRIIAFRTEQGKFTNVEELRRVKGIGKKLFAKIQPFIDIQ